MTVTRNDQRTGPGITLLDHNLMSNPSSSRVEVDTLGFRKLFNLPVLG